MARIKLDFGNGITGETENSFDAENLPQWEWRIYVWKERKAGGCSRSEENMRRDMGAALLRVVSEATSQRGSRANNVSKLLGYAESHRHVFQGLVWKMAMNSGRWSRKDMNETAFEELARMMWSAEEWNPNRKESHINQRTNALSPGAVCEKIIDCSKALGWMDENEMGVGLTKGFKPFVRFIGAAYLGEHLATSAEQVFIAGYRVAQEEKQKTQQPPTKPATTPKLRKVK